MSIDTRGKRQKIASRGEQKISCRGLWKLFGPDSEKFLQDHQTAPTPESLKASGYIAAVQDASFDVYEGEIFVIMGLSGSGKSTLVRCLSRLIDATVGEVIFDGQTLQGLSEKELVGIRRHKMGMVFQNFALLPHLTVLGNVVFPLEIQGMDRASREKRGLEMINLVGLDGRENYYPRELSGGQQQRVGIARSLAVEPEVWFLDEPFSALDPLIRREMQDEFLRLQNVLRKTIIFITHDFDEAIRLADRIAIMKDGKIIQIGTPEELVLTPADAYVREFTKDIPRAKVLSAQTVMVPVGDAAMPGLKVAPHTKIADLAPRMFDANDDALVVDSGDAPLGLITREVVIDVFVRGG